MPFTFCSLELLQIALAQDDVYHVDTKAKSHNSTTHGLSESSNHKYTNYSNVLRSVFVLLLSFVDNDITSVGQDSHPENEVLQCSLYHS